MLHSWFHATDWTDDFARTMYDLVSGWLWSFKIEGTKEAWFFVIKLYVFDYKQLLSKAKLLQEGIFFLIHLFARDVLVMKKLEIKKTKPTFIISVLKVE